MLARQGSSIKPLKSPLLLLSQVSYSWFDLQCDFSWFLSSRSLPMALFLSFPLHQSNHALNVSDSFLRNLESSVSTQTSGSITHKAHTPTPVSERLKKEKEGKLEPNLKIFCLPTTKQIFESSARPSFLFWSFHILMWRKTRQSGTFSYSPQMSCLL